MIEEFIKTIKHMSSYKKQIVHIEKMPAQEANFGELEKRSATKLANLHPEPKYQALFPPSPSH